MQKQHFFLSPEMKEQRICLNVVDIGKKELSCFNFEEKYYFFLGISQCFSYLNYRQCSSNTQHK